MKLAYLILAHSQPRHVARLVRVLQDDEASFFVHVDRKVDVGPFERIFANESNVLVLARRQAVFWGGFSQVRAVLALVAAARGAGVPFTHYCLLSDFDFPIKSKAHIKGALASDSEFISIEQPLEAAGRRLRRNMFKRHFYDLHLLNPREGRTRWSRGLRQGLVRLNNAVNLCLPDRVFPLALAPCRGSQWWCLSGPCMEHILRFLEENPDYAHFFRLTRASDEIFFHTIVNASPFKSRAVRHFEWHSSKPNDRGSHYIDWTGGGASPKVLDEGDLDPLLQSSCLFARKFSESRSRRLLSELEKHVS
jgi:hypothetical protein